MRMIEAVLLGIVQGLTEFLPVSSTGHLIVARWLFGWQGALDSLTFDIALHAGTFLSLLICLWRDILDILGGKWRLLALLAVGTIPAGIAGVLFEETVENTLRSPYIVVFTLVAFGIVMLVAERFKKVRGMEDLRASDALLIGLAQAVALMPGVSRSGITISAALMLGLHREAGARFSFLLSMPVIAGAGFLAGKELIQSPEGHDAGLFISGFIASAVAGTLAIKFLLGYLKRHPLNAFAYYRFALAAFMAGVIWVRG